MTGAVRGAERAVRTLSTPSIRGATRQFQSSMPSYRSTPLVEVPALAAELDVGNCAGQAGIQPSRLTGLQDPRCVLGGELRSEPSQRLRRTSTKPEPELRERFAPAPTTLVTATDGNHGRAVARMAALLGFSASHIRSGGNGREHTVEEIASEGARGRADRPDRYDDVVRAAASSTTPRPPGRSTYSGHGLAGL